MADIRFACPICQQHIQAEPGYAGMQISCPACKSSIVVPGAALAPVAVSTAPMPAFAGSATQAPAYAMAPASAAPASAATGATCPSCAGVLPRGAVLCTQCGYNLITKKRMVAGRPAPLGKPSTAVAELAWYKTPYPYLAGIIVLLLGLYIMGRSNPAMMLVFLGAAVVYMLAVHICAVVAAFKESVGTGFLTLCIPFYALYFVYKVSDSETLKLFYTVAVLINIGLRIAGRFIE